MTVAVVAVIVRYAGLSGQYTCYPVTGETQGVLNEMAYELVGNLSRRIAWLSGDDRESCF